MCKIYYIILFVPKSFLIFFVICDYVIVTCDIYMTSYYGIWQLVIVILSDMVHTKSESL